ncbi:MAG: TetR family transcriptional regulator [Rubellimicrobium sp.]|nr:TetR family transcriptional regulator [Rubellimicrobium sp.]
MTRTDTKGRIIEGAARLVLANGISSFTLDAVAREAGVSKGGLLYHFPSKQQLLLAMVNALVAITEERIAEVQAEDTGPGSWLRGFIEASIVREDPKVGSVSRLSVAFLTAAATDTALLAPMAERQPAWREQLRTSGVDPTLAHIIRLASDGLWINDALGLPVLDDAERAAVFQRLHEMTFPEPEPET